MNILIPMNPRDELCVDEACSILFFYIYFVNWKKIIVELYVAIFNIR